MLCAEKLLPPECEAIQMDRNPPELQAHEDIRMAEQQEMLIFGRSVRGWGDPVPCRPERASWRK